MKPRLFGVNFLLLLTTAAAHSAHEEGYHGQEQSILPQVDPILIGSITMMTLGIFALAFSYRKYRKEN